MPPQEIITTASQNLGSSNDGTATEATPPEVTPEKFIIDWPLYVKAKIEDFSPPEKITLYCNRIGCKKERTWDKSYVPRTLAQGVADPQILSVEYHCHHCGRERLTIIYRRMKYKENLVPTASLEPLGPPPAPRIEHVLVEVMKVGQYPAFSVAISKALEEGLGENGSALYKKALISRNNGYGLAAVVYMRRVVEDKTNELIEVAAQLAESHGIEAQLISTIRSAADSTKYTTYEDKLRFASTVFPDQLKAGAINPLQTLYGLVSEGIHSKTEEECIEVADKIKYVFEYVFTKLKAQITEQKEFIEKMKDLTKQKANRDSLR